MEKKFVKAMNTLKLLVNLLNVVFGTMVNVGLQLDKILVLTKKMKVHAGAQLENLNNELQLS